MGYYAVKTPNLLKAYYPNLLWNFSREKKEIYLTFDDGPTTDVTPWVLDCLDEYDAKATFFCIGKNIVKHPDIVKNIIKRGHAVGNHSFKHENGWKTSLDNYLASTHETNEILRTHGIATKLFRPPYGRIKKNQIKALRKLDYTIVMWDVLSADFDQSLGAKDCYNNVVNATENGSVIVFHDSVKAEVRLRGALPRILSHLKDKGYTFKTLS